VVCAQLVCATVRAADFCCAWAAACVTWALAAETAASALCEVARAESSCCAGSRHLLPARIAVKIQFALHRRGLGLFRWLGYCQIACASATSALA